jgi:hypothetical protein
MANNTNVNDISDIRPASTPEVTPTQLPIRGEKRIINCPVDPNDLNSTFESIDKVRIPNRQTVSADKVSGYGTKGGAGRQQLVEQGDFYKALALEPFVDYVIVRIPNRGVTANGQPDATSPAIYRFLINPSQVQVNRNTLDAQAMSRAGWQIGVWGEDVVQVSLTGKTAGQYWSFGDTDTYMPFTESYRNLLQLQMVFENNGYWFEGEQLGEGPLAADFTRRRIKMHQDVQLIVGNFWWFGMFESLTISQSADEPWLMSFQMNFIAWKERFRSGSPYPDTIHNSTERGHSYSAWASAANASASSMTPTTASNPQTLGVPTQPTPPPAPNAPPVSPAVTSAAADNLLPSADPCSLDSSPTLNILYPLLPQYSNFWNGVM